MRHMTRPEQYWACGSLSHELITLAKNGGTEPKPNQAESPVLSVCRLAVTSARQRIAWVAMSVYNKVGVSTRAGATLFALEHGLVSADLSVSAG